MKKYLSFLTLFLILIFLLLFTPYVVCPLSKYLFGGIPLQCSADGILSQVKEEVANLKAQSLLNYTGNTLTLQNGQVVDIPVSGDVVKQVIDRLKSQKLLNDGLGLTFDGQNLSLVGNTNGNGGPIDLSKLSKQQNEQVIQTLSINGNTLSISNGNSILLPSVQSQIQGNLTNLSVTNNSSLNNLQVSGTSNFNNISVSGTTNLNGSVNISNSLITSGPNILNGNSTIENLTVNGSTSFNGHVTFNTLPTLPLALGSILVGNNSNVASELPVGSHGNILSVQSGVPTWTNLITLLGSNSLFNISNGLINDAVNGGDTIIYRVGPSNNLLVELNGNNSISYDIVPNPVFSGLSVNGNSNFNGNIGVAGVTTTNNLVVTGDTMLNTLTTNGNVINNSNVTNNGDTLLNTLNVSGATNLTSLNTIGPNVLGGNTTIENLTTSGLVTNNGDIENNGQVTFNDQIFLNSTALNSLVNIVNSIANSINLSGDISGTLGSTILGANTVDSSKIVDGSISTADLADGSVTLSKLANCSADGHILKYYVSDPDGAGSLVAGWNCDTSSIGSNTITSAMIVDGTITSSDISVGGVTTLNILDGTISLADLASNSVDSSKIVDGTISLADLASNSVDSSKIVDGTISLADLASNSVDSSKIVDGTISLADLASNSVDSSKIVDGTISLADLASNSVDSSKIVDGTISLADLASNSVDSSKIVDGSISTADLADGSVTLSKLANCSADGHILKYYVSDPDGAGSLVAGWNCDTNSIGSNTITSAMIVDGTITSSDISVGGVTTLNILDGTISLADLASNSVDSSKIVDGSISTADLADGSVTLSKLANCSADGHILKYYVSDPDGAGSLVAGWNCDTNSIGSNTITSAMIVDGTITSSDISVGGVTTLNILDGTISLADLASNSVDSSKIVDGSISTADLADGSVTLSKLANCSADGHILKYYVSDPDGAGSLVAGWNCDTNSIGSNTITSAMIVDGTITSSDISVGGVTTLNILDGTISLADLASNSVDSSKIIDGTISLADLASNSVDSSKIVDGTISLADLASNSVDSTKIVNGTISLADLASNSVDSSKIVDGSVSTADLADGSVTLSKIANCIMDNQILKYFTVDPDGGLGPMTVGWNCIVDVATSAVNGLNMVGTTTYLGGPLIQDTNITNSGWDLNLVGSSTTSTFDSTGRIGIGTNTPQTLLHEVLNASDASLSAFGYSNMAAYYENLQAASVGTMYRTNSTGGTERNAVIGLQPNVYGGNGSFTFEVGSNGILLTRIAADTTTGNWVVGTGLTSASAPGSKLSVLGNFAVGRNYQTIGAPINGAIFEGTVGIGTSAPTNKLHINATNPLRLQGLQPGVSTDNILTTDATGVVRELSMSALLGATGTKVAVFAGDIDVQGQIDPNSIAFSTGLTGTYNAATNNGYWIGPSSVAEQRPVFVAPSTDAAGAFEVRKADLSTSVLTVNTINSRVGIGVANPTVSLDVMGRARMRSSGATSAISFLNLANTVDLGMVGLIDDLHIGFVGNAGGGAGLVMNVATGNVGVGTSASNPPRRLTVKNDADNLVASFTYSTSTCTVNALVGLTCTSDQRLKENINSINDGLSVVSKLNPVSYTWKNAHEAGKYFGFIAQEVQQVIPEAVSEDKTSGYLTLSSIELLPYVVKSIQEIDQKITALTPSSQVAKLDYDLANDQTFKDLESKVDDTISDIEKLKSEYDVLISTMNQNNSDQIEKSISDYFKNNKIAYLLTGENEITAINVKEDLVVGNTLIVNGTTTLKGYTKISGDVEFEQEITVSNNTAGTVSVNKSATKVKVLYERPKVGSPVVTLTPRDVEEGVSVSFSVVNSDRLGFEIQIETSGIPQKDYKFNWVSLSVK